MSYFTPFSSDSIVDFGQVNISWVYYFPVFSLLVYKFTFHSFISFIYLDNILLLPASKHNTQSILHQICTCTLGRLTQLSPKFPFYTP